MEQTDTKLPRKDGSTIRLKTERGYLICSFSKKRFNKDKYEIQKQIDRAKTLLEQPSKAKKIKYLKSGESKLELNEKLIAKSTKLLGVKGYYTDIATKVASNGTIIERYHDLYKIEQNFRVAKGDLRTRPIYHFKEDSVQLHVLICFMALAISKHIELSASFSIRAFMDQCKKTTEARLLNRITEKEIHMRSTVPPELREIVVKILRPH